MFIIKDSLKEKLPKPIQFTNYPVKAWRNFEDNKISRIKGNQPCDSEKIILFEQAINYIINTKYSCNSLVKEILGFSDTNCKSFYELSIDNSIFFYKDITQPITYLICFCFLKEYYLNNSNNISGIIINKLTISNWLKKILDNKVFFNIEEAYIQEVQILNQFVYFSSIYKNLCPVKLNKIQKLNSQNIVPLYTKKPLKFNLLNETYSNHDGNCIGTSIYWLEQQILAYEESGLKRQKIKNEFVRNLQTSSFKDIKYIRNDEITELIRKYQNNSWNNNKLQHVQNLYYSNNDTVKMINDLLEIMQINNLDKFYILMFTYEHAMGVSIINRGSGFKLNFYDPNNNLLYWHIHVNNNDILNDNLLITNMPYLKEKYGEILVIRLECYILKTSHKKYQSIENILPAIHTEEYLNQQLILGVNLNDETLVKTSLESGADPNFSFNGQFALTIAVGNLNKSIITLLIKYNATLDCETDNGLTPLIIAIIKEDLQIINILLKAGASVNLKTLSSTNNKKILNLLKM